MSPGQLKYYLNQIDDQIKNIEAGGKIPDEVIQTIRKDPKFRSVHQTRSTDPDMFEMEQVILDYGKKHAEGGIAGQLHLNQGGRARFANGSPHTYDTGGWQLATPDKNKKRRPPKEGEELRKDLLEWLKKQKEFEDSLAVSKELPEELPPFEGPPYETDNPKEAGKEILRRIIGGGVKGAGIGGGLSIDSPYGGVEDFDIGIGYKTDPGYGGISGGYGINLDGDDTMGIGYQGDNFGAGVTKKESAEPQFTFGFKKKLKKKPKYIFQAKGGLAKVLGV